MTVDRTPHDPYDAVLIVSFGGPEGMDDVIPFLENVLRGRSVPRERMLEVAGHYALFGGVSPINSQVRALAAALQERLAASGPDLPVYWGNRNWHPLLAETLSQMKANGVKHALAFFTSPYSSYSGCRQYREDIARARAEVGPGAPQVSVLRKFYNHPGFIYPNVINVRRALNKIPAPRRAGAHVAFTAHSIPVGMAQNCAYAAQLEETCRLIAEELDHPHWRLVYQSRSGSPAVPWLEPDIIGHLRTLKDMDVVDVVIAPVGFISDHMEVIYDLDTEARQSAEGMGLNVVRAATVGTHPDFVSMIRELIVERMAEHPGRRFLGSRGPGPDECPANCCPPGQMRPAPQTDGVSTRL